MAASVQLSVGGEFRAQSNSPQHNFIAAVGGDKYAIDRVLCRPHFNIVATTDSNDAAGSSNIALDLSANGLAVAGGALATNQRRDIKLTCKVTNTEANPDTWFEFETVTTIGNVSGELVIIGANPRFLTSCIAQFSATLASSATPTAVAAECFPPAWWKGASPTAAQFGTGDGVITWLGANAPVGSIVPLSASVGPTAQTVDDAFPVFHKVTSLANGTSTLYTAHMDGTEALIDPADGILSATASITPPMSATLSINATPTPDTLILSLVGIASIDLLWQVGVTIGDPYGIV